jgi:DNA polymerase elongation subunit (family B)
MKVVYGHTDSIYVEMPMNRAEETLALLNNHVRGLFPNLLGLKEHPVTLEFEKYYESLGVGITKNRNAGLISWKDGVTLDEPEFVMTGFAAKRVAITQLAKDIQLTVLKMWVEQKSEQEITNYLKTEYNKVLNGEIDIKNITNRSRFKPERVRYKCNYCSKEYDG